MKKRHDVGVQVAPKAQSPSPPPPVQRPKRGPGGCALCLSQFIHLLIYLFICYLATYLLTVSLFTHLFIYILLIDLLSSMPSLFL